MTQGALFALSKKKTDKNHLTKQQEVILPAFWKACRKVMIGRHVYLSIHIYVYMGQSNENWSKL